MLFHRGDGTVAQPTRLTCSRLFVGQPVLETGPALTDPNCPLSGALRCLDEKALTEGYEAQRVCLRPWSGVYGI